MDAPVVKERPGGDFVFRPQHYADLFPEPITVINAWGLGFNLGNVIKYVARAGRKDPEKYVEDLLKARRYLDIEITAYERKKRVAEGADKTILVETL